MPHTLLIDTEPSLSYAVPPPPLTLRQMRATCTDCAMQQLCLPMGLEKADKNLLDKIIRNRHRICRDESLYQIGDPFKNLYAVRFGHFKTYQINASGKQQITGFQMAGDLLGLDAIGASRYQNEAVALEDSEVCEIPFAGLDTLFGHAPGLLHNFHKMMSQEITREQNVMLLLGTMRAERRFAIFLDNLSSHYMRRGRCANTFQLRMSREDIGNYLGLTNESISRLFLRFKQHGWIKADKREVHLLEPDVLKALASGTKSCLPI
jgi:CRP/FNR family transcriptional regulator